MSGWIRVIIGYILWIVVLLIFNDIWLAFGAMMAYLLGIFVDMIVNVLELK